MEPSRITVEEAKDKLDHGQEIFFLDTRTEEAWTASDQKLPGTMRLKVDEVEFWSHKLPRDKLIVTYCS
ncbi:MAG TPA: hypothetical protein VFP47_12770 [Pyrinomonadaceae bacterium]|nr:hypothetical protein [Pyrinomonadaceae bacterium]